jgi:GNAT superfamily N-acetyltransferase
LDDETPPFFEDALRRAAERAEEKLERQVRITVFTHLNERMMAKLEAIDHEKFRRELWYTQDELAEKAEKKDFMCTILSVEGEPTAFVFGYDHEEDPTAYFLDELTTLIEGKGLGKILITLALIYCYELDYRAVILYTEETDQVGRHLREFYEHVGFKYIATDPDRGVIMRYDIEEKALVALYRRVMYAEGGPFPPYLKRV